MTKADNMTGIWMHFMHLSFLLEMSNATVSKIIDFNRSFTDDEGAECAAPSPLDINMILFNSPTAFLLNAALVNSPLIPLFQYGARTKSSPPQTLH